MYRTWIIQSFRFFSLVLFQVLILNHLNLGNYICPCLYVWFILLLPFQIPGWVLLLLGFFLGLTIDLFTYTPGLNAAATTLMAFMRPFVIRLISRVPEEELGKEPSLRNNGFTWYLLFALILVLIHHTVLFYLELFRLAGFFHTLLRVLISTGCTVGLVLTGEGLFFNRRSGV